jgi:putative membrane protein
MRKILQKPALAVAAALLCMGTSSRAQQPGGGMGAPQSPQNPASQGPQGTMGGSSTMPGTMDSGGAMDSQRAAIMDKSFIADAIEGGLTEVQLGKLAADKASDPEVKAFGQKMVDDHTRLGDQLKQVADKMQITPPASPSKKQQQTIARLQGLSGADFDHAYVKNMVKDHRKDLADFKRESAATQNQDLKSAVDQGIPVIDEHLHMSEGIEKIMNGGKQAGGRAGTGSQP